MHTIRLKINEKVYDKFIWFLNRFTKDEVEIIPEDEEFDETREYLEQELKEIESGKATFYSQEEVEKRLDQVIRKHED
ncbi:MAG: tRNA pseudouridine synthase A [Bacteroidota bacterium]